MGETEKRNMRHPFQLPADGRLNRRMGVTVDVGPDGRIPIQIAPPLGIPQPHPLATHQNQWFMIRRAPLGLPCERMPAVRTVGLDPSECVLAHRAATLGMQPRREKRKSITILRHRRLDLLVHVLAQVLDDVVLTVRGVLAHVKGEQFLHALAFLVFHRIEPHVRTDHEAELVG